MNEQPSFRSRGSMLFFCDFISPAQIEARTVAVGDGEVSRQVRGLGVGQCANGLWRHCDFFASHSAERAHYNLGATTQGARIQWTRMIVIPFGCYINVSECVCWSSRLAIW